MTAHIERGVNRWEHYIFENGPIKTCVGYHPKTQEPFHFFVVEIGKTGSQLDKARYDQSVQISAIMQGKDA